MVQVIGLLALIGLVFGALITSSAGIAEALPCELALLIGASLGVLFVGNSPRTAMAALSGFAKAIRGPTWKKADYLSLLSLLHSLTSRARRQGIVAIENDIEHPEQSPAFHSAPSILRDDDARTLICNTFRLMGLDLSDPGRAEEAMSRQIDARVEARGKSVDALHTVADALPALGIVAAVIGIIRAMGVIDQAPEVIGSTIAAALLGTFLGVFLAYGIVSPVATRFGQVLEEEDALMETIRHVLSAYAAGHPPRTCVELARLGIPSRVQPDADELSQALHRGRFAARQTSVAA
ncbi:MAG: motility-associated protein [Pseudomonadota bacterium]